VKPHAKSSSLGGLATHLANNTKLDEAYFRRGRAGYCSPGAPPFRLEQAKSSADLLAAFDKNIQEARAAMASAGDERWLRKMVAPAGRRDDHDAAARGVMRGFVLSHLIHHRAQLGVYLRLLDVPVPAIYGPSADEGGF